MKEFEYAIGEHVWYDDNRGVVLHRIPSERVVSDDYEVRWDNGHVSAVWGSDLLNERDQREFDIGVTKLRTFIPVTAEEMFDAGYPGYAPPTPRKLKRRYRIAAAVQLRWWDARRSVGYWIAGEKDA